MAGHEKPDGDTIGSELAMDSLLRRFGKRSIDIYNRQPVPRYLQFMPNCRRIKTAQRVSKTYDVAIIFECSNQDRMGNIIDLKKQARRVINIDHHSIHTDFGHINMIDPSASSTSELIFHVFDRARYRLTLTEATCLYVGLVTDTGRFQQDNTTPDSHAVAVRLLEAKIPVADISRNLYGTAPVSAIRLLGIALSSLRLAERDRVAILTLRRADFARAGSSDEETEGIINQGLKIPSVVVSILVREMSSGRIKVSLRSKNSFNVNEIVRSFNGGGHRHAAGCTLSGSIETVTQTVLRSLSAAFRTHSASAR